MQLARGPQQGLHASASRNRRSVRMHGTKPQQQQLAARTLRPGVAAPQMGLLRPCVARAAVAVREGRALPAREEVITGQEGNNVSDYIYQKMGANLHQQPDHPIGIIKQVRAEQPAASIACSIVGCRTVQACTGACVWAPCQLCCTRWLAADPCCCKAVCAFSISLQAIYEYFDTRYPGQFNKFDDLNPLVSTKANFDEVRVDSNLWEAMHVLLGLDN
jgi:hypothetical protein